MTHISLYRKWRPPSFEQLVGQEHVARTLINAINRDEVAHAYLFAGPRGTGKTSTAKILAKAINCAEGPTPQPCGKCENCLRIAEGNSLDVLEIDAASNRGIDEIRELRERIAFSPAAGRKKIYIIDEVHMLTEPAFNALLKILEEPPEHVVFVLATTEPHKVLPTILSRCQRFDFRRIPVPDLVAQLKVVAKAEKIDADAEALALIARQSDGSLRDAIGALDQLAAYTGKKVTAAEVVDLFGLIEADLLFESVDLLASGQPGEVFSLVNQLVSGGRDLGHFLSELLNHLRNLFIVHNVASDQELQALIDGGPDYLARLKKQAGGLDAGEVRRLMQEFGELHLAMRQVTDSRLAFEIGLVRAAAGPPPARTPTIQPPEAAKLEAVKTEAVKAQTIKTGVVKATDAGQRAERPSTKPEPAKVPSTPSAPAPAKSAKQAAGDRGESAPTKKTGQLSLAQVQAAWESVLGLVKKERLSAGVLLLDARPTALADTTLTLTFTSDFNKRESEKPVNVGVLTEALQATLGVEINIVCECQPSAPSADDVTMATVADQADKPAEPAPKADRPDDLINLVQEGFGAEVVEEISHDGSSVSMDEPSRRGLDSSGEKVAPEV